MNKDIFESKVYCCDCKYESYSDCDNENLMVSTPLRKQSQECVALNKNNDCIYFEEYVKSKSKFAKTFTCFSIYIGFCVLCYILFGVVGVIFSHIGGFFIFCFLFIIYGFIKEVIVGDVDSYDM
jgi:hypothetical protein